MNDNSMCATLKGRPQRLFWVIGILLSIFAVQKAWEIFATQEIPNRRNVVHGSYEIAAARDAAIDEGQKRLSAVLIQTNFRSGSSFFGELFNQRDDVFYSYEPLIATTPNNVSQMVSILNSSFSCRFSDVSYLKSNNHGLDDTIKQCKRHNVCFRNRMKSLCSSKFCARPLSCTGCLRLTPVKIAATCRSKSLVVVKAIRLDYLRSVQDLMEDEKLDLRIIHLVRDPRGISSSRAKRHGSSDMKSTCKRILENAKLGLLNPPKWLQGRYKLIRYEDVARDPIWMAQRVYDLLGLEMTEAMQRWISINTQGEIFRSSDPKARQLWEMRRRRRLKLPPSAFKQMVLNDPFTTVRRSNATWRAWVHKLDRSAIQAIESDCEEMMGLLGYRLVGQSKNHLEEPLLDELPSFNIGTIQSQSD